MIVVNNYSANYFTVYQFIVLSIKCQNKMNNELNNFAEQFSNLLIYPTISPKPKNIHALCIFA